MTSEEGVWTVTVTERQNRRLKRGLAQYYTRCFVVAMATTKLTLQQHPLVCLLGWLASLVSCLLWRDLNFGPVSLVKVKALRETHFLPHTRTHAQPPDVIKTRCKSRYKSRTFCGKKRADFCLTSSPQKRAGFGNAVKSVPITEHYRCVDAYFLQGFVFFSGVGLKSRRDLLRTKSVLIKSRGPLRIISLNRFLWTNSFRGIRPSVFWFIRFIYKAFALNDRFLYFSEWCWSLHNCLTCLCWKKKTQIKVKTVERVVWCRTNTTLQYSCASVDLHYTPLGHSCLI